jgi:hypothetical protein
MSRKRIWKSGRQEVTMSTGRTYIVNDSASPPSRSNLAVDGDVHVDAIDARGYFSWMPDDQSFIAPMIAPEIPVMKSSNFFQLVPRPTGKPDTNGIGPTGPLVEIDSRAGTKKYDARQFGFLYRIADVDERNADVLSLEEQGYNALRLYEMLWLEQFMKERVDALTATAALSGSGQWSHADSDPVAEIRKQVRAARLKGPALQKPNCLGLGYEVWDVLRYHPQMIAALTSRFTPASGRVPDYLMTDEAAMVLQLDHVAVGDVTYLDDNDDTTATDLWGDIAFLCSRNMQPQGSVKYSTFGNVVVADAYRLGQAAFVDRPLTVRNLMVEGERDIVVIADETGYRWTDVLA